MVEAARKDARELEVFLTLVGVEGRPTVTAKVLVVGGDGPENDFALLEIVDGPFVGDKARVNLPAHCVTETGCSGPGVSGRTSRAETLPGFCTAPTRSV